MSTINVQCNDQVLAITNSPVIASGGANENYIQFSFCQLWTGYAKIAVFYVQRGTYYYSLVDATDKCVIPAECCTSEGKIHFGVVGTLNNVTRTTEVLTYRIVEGVFTEIEDPTPSIYQQILSDIASLRAFVSNELANSEAWAVGTRNGTDVPSTDPAYNNNSKYWAGMSNQSATKRNMLDNWSFINPVNQREVTGTISTAGYFLDRWKLTSGSVTINSGSITLNGTIVQILENSIGQSVIATALTDSGITDVIPTYDDATKTLTITASNKTIKAVKLELGSLQTLAHQENGSWVLNEIPDYGEQLLRCMRFYQCINTTSGDSHILGTGYAQSQDFIYCCINLSVPMKSCPTISYTTSVSVRGKGTPRGVSGISAMNINGTLLTVKVTTSAELVPSELYTLYCFLINRKFEFSADL